MVTGDFPIRNFSYIDEEIQSGNEALDGIGGGLPVGYRSDVCAD
jgi:hypothetical protein